MSTRDGVVGSNVPTLRAAAVGDLPRVEGLLAAAALPTVGVAQAIATFFVAEQQGELIGVAGLELCSGNGLLRSVAVAPAWQNHGLGRALVMRVIAEAEKRGLHALYLLTTSAEHYFPAFGFLQITREAVPSDLRATAEFKGACPDSAIVMVRPVTT